MATVVGLDLSLTGFGVAVFNNRRVYTATLTSELWADVNGWARAARRARLRKELREHLGGGRGDVLAVTEERIPPTKGWQSTLDRAELRGTVDDELYARAIPIVEVSPGTLKKYATGRGDADKRTMKARAIDVCGTTIRIDDDNQADAFWLMVMAIHHYGLVPALHPLWLAVHSRSMDRVAWPQWTPREGIRV